MYYIGIDIGGMSIKGGLVTENGELVLKQSIVTRPTANEDVIIDDIHKLICSLLENKGLHEYQLSGVGIGVPGTVDGEKGRVRFTPNINFKTLRWWKSFPQGFSINFLSVSRTTRTARPSAKRSGAEAAAFPTA